MMTNWESSFYRSHQHQQPQQQQQFIGQDNNHEMIIDQNGSILSNTPPQTPAIITTKLEIQTTDIINKYRFR